MFGPDHVLSSGAPLRSAADLQSVHGIVPRACVQLFSSMADCDDDVTFVVRLTCVEVYNDRLRDLLRSEPCPPREGAASREGTLLLRETASGGLRIEGLSHHLVSSPEEVLELLRQASANRVVAAMRMNERSSRGHMATTLHVTEVASAEGAERSARLVLVDLAGMESSKKSYCVEGPVRAPQCASPHSARGKGGRDRGLGREGQRLGEGWAITPVQCLNAGMDALDSSAVPQCRDGLQLDSHCCVSAAANAFEPSPWLVCARALCLSPPVCACAPRAPAQSAQSSQSAHLERQEEVRHINQSLWALGTVIERLSSLSCAAPTAHVHVPYRDSKLTRLLQDSLAGGCKSAFLATLRAEEVPGGGSGCKPEC